MPRKQGTSSVSPSWPCMATCLDGNWGMNAVVTAGCKTLPRTEPCRQKKDARGLEALGLGRHATPGTNKGNAGGAIAGASKTGGAAGLGNTRCQREQGAHTTCKWRSYAATKGSGGFMTSNVVAFVCRTANV